MRQFALIVSFLLLTGCGFHLVNSKQYTINLSSIKPKSERQQYEILASSEGFKSSLQSHNVVNDLKYHVEYLADKNTGNIWRQYEITAEWSLTTKAKTQIVIAKEIVNLSSNQSPNERTFSEFYVPIRKKLLFNTYAVIRRGEMSLQLHN